MALPTATPAPSLSPEVVGNAFVEQYYHVLHRSPELVYRFYQDSSILSRLDSNGVMISVTSTQAINDMILSLDFKNYISEILTVDSQPSYKDGVFILVRGCLTGQDKIQRKFSQSFFLAPQDNGGFFVLNDVFRFVDESQLREVNQMLVNGTDDVSVAPLTHEQEVASVQDLHATDPATPLSAGLPANGDEDCNLSENGSSVVEDEAPMDRSVHPSHIDTQPVSEMTTIVQEYVPKQSYASIVKVVKGSASPVPVYVPTTMARPAPANPEKPPTVPTTKARPAPANPEKPSTVPTSKARPTPVNPEKPPTSTMPTPAPEIPAASSTSTSENNISHEEGHSIYIRNLPLNATAPQVEEEFKKFGPIKSGGVQVRSHKLERFCFGFVEFDSSDSMQAAIEASPVTFGGRQAFIEEKRTRTRVVNGVVSGGGSGRGRYPFVRGGGGGFRNDNFMGGRGSFAGNQGGFLRNEFRNNRGGGDYSGRERGPPPGRAGDGYQPRIVQNGYGRMGRPNTMNQATVAA